MTLETIFPYDEIFEAKADTLKLEVYKDGVAVECSAASYTLYNSGRTVIASGSITPTGTPANILSVPVAADAFKTIEENNSIEWTFTADSEVRSFNNFFDVVKWKIYANVIDSDLEQYYPDIQDHLWTNQANYSPQIQLAWKDVKRDIKAKGRRPSLIVVDADIKKLIELKSFIHIFNAWFRSATDDVWLLRAQEAEKAYQDQFRKTTLRYDESQDGVIDNKQNLGMGTLRR
jgi:hypothetical protein